MELQTVTVEKFKKVKKVKLQLSGLNILVGANGSGKSSILQAIHLASCLMRQAKELRLTKTSPVSINELDYLPSDDYAKLGHNNSWGNTNSTPSSKVQFSFTNADSEEINAWSEFRSARNAGISVQGAAPGSSLPLFRKEGAFFSAYIPGVSGIPNKEQKQSKRVVLKACSFGDSNVYLRNALNLLKKEEIKDIERWLKDIISPLTLSISYNEDKDLYINVNARIEGKDHPLELLGAGFLQLIQIFCYILLFKPQILLIDEPDIHLHPDVQEKLTALLARIADERKIKILLTTHSPFVVRGMPLNAKIFWMEKGQIKDSNRDAIELAMGWGAFGKKIIIASEDKNQDLLKKLISQWPSISQHVAFFPGKGYSNLMKRDEASELYNTLGKKYHILVHRDRDSLTNQEVSRLQSEYNTEGVTLWFTDHSDIESYYCLPQFLEEFLSITIEDAEEKINNLLNNKSTEIQAQFESQRSAHNKEIHSTGGSPSNNEVWIEKQGNPLKGAKGKYIFKQLKQIIPQNRFSEILIQKHRLNKELAPSLKSTLLNIIGQS